MNIRRVFIFAHPNPQKGEGLTREQAKAMAEAVKSAIAGKKDVIATINAIPHGRTDVVADPICFPFSAEPCRPPWTRPHSR